MQAFLKDEIGDGAIGSFGGISPCDIADKVGGFAFQNGEIVPGFKRSNADLQQPPISHIPMISFRSSQARGLNCASPWARFWQSVSVRSKGRGSPLPLPVMSSHTM